MGFEIGDLVWAKMKGFPPWPAQIINPKSIPNAKVAKSKKAHHFVVFFGSNDCAWIPDENIMHNNKDILETLTKKKSKAYQHAIDEFMNYSGTIEKQTSSKMKEKVESKKKSTKVIKIVQSVSKKKERDVLVQKSVIKRAPKRRSLDSGKSSVNSPSKSGGIGAVDDIPKTDASSDVGSDSNRHSVERDQFMENLPGCSSDSNQKYVPDNIQLGIEDEMDLDNEDLDTKFDKKFGFIGLDEFGRSVLTKFIKRGMDVTLWHEDIDQCAEFVDVYKTKLADSPAQLILDCDITFCCYDTDTDAFKNIIFEPKGILEGFEEAERLKTYKGFVVLNSIDCKISEEINAAITIKNGYYLEAPVLGASENVDGELIVLASGNRNLYISCEKCFKIIATKVQFLSCEIGASSKTSVMLNAVSGTILAAMSEVMILSDRLNLKKDDVHRIFKNVLLGDTLGKKVRQMSEHNYSQMMIPLKHVQKDMNFGLNLANGVSQCMPVTSAANEVFKHARLLKYADSDVSAIYKVVKLF